MQQVERVPVLYFVFPMTGLATKVDFTASAAAHRNMGRKARQRIATF